MILASPSFGLLKNKFPDIQIDVLASRHNSGIIKNNPNIDNIIILQKSPKKIINFIFRLRKQYYDYYLDPKDHYSREGALIACLVRAKNKIYYNHNLIETETRHYSDIYTSALSIFNIHLDKMLIPELFTELASDIYVDNFFKENNLQKPIVLNISAGEPYRMLDSEKWSEFLNRNKDFRFVISFSPEHKVLAETIINSTQNSLSFLSRSFDDAISLIKSARMLISPDTSLVHVAAAFNIDLLGLYSGLEENYLRFEPRSDRKEIIRSSPGSWGIASITVDEIDAGFRRLLNADKVTLYQV